jgi:hypothetical protein
MALPNTATAGIWNRSAYQGDTYIWNFTVTVSNVAVDLSSAVVTMTVKKSRGATVAEIWEGSTTSGDIVIGGVGNNAVNITIPAADMEDFPAGSWVYDVQFAEAGVVHTYLTGAFTVTAEVTA